MKAPPEQNPKSEKPNGNSVEFPDVEIERSVPEQFEKIVLQYPDRLAVKMGNRAFTYDELNRAANRIAHAILEKRGFGSEPIALLFGQDIEAIAALLGISKAGKFYVPLDPTFPAERNIYFLHDTRAALTVTRHCNIQLAEHLTQGRSVVLNVDEILTEIQSENCELSISLDDLFGVVYTSGSTGEPKGVSLTHRQRFHDTMLHATSAAIGADDRLSLLQPPGAVAAEIQLFRSLFSGSSLFLYDVRSEGIHQMARWLQDERITVLHTTPAVFRQLSELIPERNRLSNLRLIQLSGAPITMADFNAYKEKFSSRALLGFHMGSTEAGATCSAVVDQGFSFPETGAPVGYPYSSKTIVLLDDDRCEVLVGEIGEIAVKSRYLAEGYWRRPDLTAVKFLPDPDGGDKRIYLTGDLGRKLPDGFLLHLGRKDFMVKIRGNRVELGEIEKTLLTHPQVLDAAVVAWDREPGEKSLAAYVVPRVDSRPTVSNLREFLAGKLPSYMLPSTLMLLDSLPLTNGKLDRKALPKPDQRRPELDTAYALPRNENERSLVQIWEEALDVHPVGIHDEFLDLGGHSLAATRIASQVVARFELEIPLQSLFQSLTIAEMAVVITEHQSRKLCAPHIENMLAELESLSDEEAQKRLSELRREDS